MILFVLMKTQHYANHAKLDPIFHGIVLIGSAIWGLLLLIGMFTLLVKNIIAFSEMPRFVLFMLLWIVLIAISLLFMAWKIRAYALKNQDRVIRFEEWFRYYVLTGKQIDPVLTVKQLIALRFAPDEEFVELCAQAIKNNMTPNEIKKSIINRRADHHRI